MVQSGCTLDNVIGWQKQYSPASSTLDEEREPLVTYNTPSGAPSNSPSRTLHGSSAFVERFRAFRYNNREFLAEFIGTLILILLTDGVAAEQTLGIGPRSWLTSSFGSGLAVLFAISVSGHISGAHINPAVTLTFWAFSGFPTRKLPVYFTAQFLGAFVGAAILYSVIYPALNEFDGGDRQILGEHGTAGIFATYPPLYVGYGAAVASEIVGTALLCLLIMVTGHPNNMPFHQSQGVFIACGLMTLSLGLGYTSGFSLNPARDFGPRLFTAVAGWGTGVFSIRNYYSFIPIFAPLIGGLIGGMTYTIFIDHA
ncbi:aquaporin-9 isoform 1 [Lichtheimia corymbifera JMRC:FSU:9682]|uniref:Aquaporin-9 isoform 1 n=1 Tax=Lichtheimia corymbifera JMRC:FSU:9682 TaxID=1263082 RepID=A0A068RXS0_9FUNG|nr:aquaporin-9 isoform 1 [Lichtheimia corymbifera JMRC:FSU:9682]